jgi:hypothetical protein
MPCGDRTGPAGMGPMTGRAAGFCAGYSVPGFMNPAGGRGYWGRGRGGGRGFRHWYYATGLPGWARFGMGYPAWGGPVGAYASAPGQVGPTMTAVQELDALKQQAEFFQDELGQINKRIEQLEAETQK